MFPVFSFIPVLMVPWGEKKKKKLWVHKFVSGKKESGRKVKVKLRSLFIEPDGS